MSRSLLLLLRLPLRLLALPSSSMLLPVLQVLLALPSSSRLLQVLLLYQVRRWRTSR